MVGPLVVGVDGSPESIDALTAAVDLAAASGRGIIVVHVRHANALAATGAVAEPGSGPAIDEALDALEARSRAEAAIVMRNGPVDWRFETAQGDPARALIAAAEVNRAAGIIVGGHRHGVVGGLITGSVAQKLVRQSPVPLYVVRDGQTHRIPSTPANDDTMVH
jgi:nucleotide-binding universal stress UspA family protein